MGWCSRSRPGRATSPSSWHGPGRYRINGLDISRTFVEIARKNAAEAGVSVDVQHGDVARMPFAAGTFDLIVCRAAFKNFADPVSALREMRRVLRDGGRALIIDLRNDVQPEEIDRYVRKLELGLIGSILTRLTFKFMLIRRVYTREQLAQFVSQRGFEKSWVEDTPIGFELWLTK